MGLFSLSKRRRANTLAKQLLTTSLCALGAYGCLAPSEPSSESGQPGSSSHSPTGAGVGTSPPSGIAGPAPSRPTAPAESGPTTPSVADPDLCNRPCSAPSACSPGDTLCQESALASRDLECVVALTVCEEGRVVCRATRSSDAGARCTTREGHWGVCSSQGICAPQGENEPGACIPYCEVCGASDGCGGVCLEGACANPGQACNQGVCACEPRCESCGGSDGCGGTCLEGACPGENEQCIEGTCECVPLCRTCGGSDGCGGVCSFDESTPLCPNEQEECIEGVCECIPRCETCGGPDGCGGTCQTGRCPTSGQSCKNGACTYCPRDEYPKYCESQYGNSCWASNVDCTTVHRVCSDFVQNGVQECQLKACRTGYKLNEDVPPSCVKK